MTSAPPVHPTIAGDAGWQRSTREFIDLLRQHYGERLHAVVLFGSRARGDAYPESDVDLLVVLNGEFDHRTEQDTVRGLRETLIDDFRWVLFGLVASVHDYRERMLPIYMNIRREGFELWPVSTSEIPEPQGRYGEPGPDDIAPVLQKGRRALTTAANTLLDGDVDAAPNRAYYAMFQAASALLLSKGLAFSKHQGVIGAFRERFIKTGLLPVTMSDAIGGAFDARNTSDYEYTTAISKKQAADLVKQASEFLAEAERYLGLGS